MPVLDSSPHPAMPEINITGNGAHKLLASLDPTKATCPHGIPYRLLREVAGELAPAVTLLFVKSLDTGLVQMSGNTPWSSLSSRRETGTKPPITAHLSHLHLM
ncbi:hypothetical protein HAZT_HAZT011892 [Hyalella azteca]|uniref:Uncharacterized protein n=1 Tax=Hyalella azteca TaxID=294128 RepID=A0A6A0H3D2_HYAAZ|nr:hypothetical protein HAZT_HAZT011892 [Hyalella azteca]